MKIMLSRILTLVCAALLLGAGARAEVQATVQDAKGKPVAEAVVYLIPAKGKAPAVKKDTIAFMDQVNKQFSPRVLPIQTGAQVRFPNKDNILHHVYSFSEAKSFELPLQKDRKSDPVLFDKPGEVAVGCNVHDWMIGYIFVVDTPWFAMTGKKGDLTIGDVPAGDYKAYVYTPDMKGDYKKTGKKVTVDKKGNGKVAFKIEMKKKSGNSRAPAPGGGFAY